MASNVDLEARVAALEARLLDAEAVLAIQDLKARYGALADARYAGGQVVEREALERIADLVVKLFTEDAVWDGGKTLGVCRGHAAIRERFLAPTLSFSWHYFVKPVIEVDGDRARATWDILAPCSDAEGRPLWMAGLEEDEYRRVDGRWLHSRMGLKVAFMAPHDRGWGKRAGFRRVPGDQSLE
jgi:hypothetical protein